MKNKAKFFFTTVIGAVLFTQAPPAHSAPSGAAFLKLESSARSYALGRSGAVSAFGAEAVGSNPANLMVLPNKMEVLTAYSTVMEGVNYAHLGGAINRSVKSNSYVDAIGFSYTNLGVEGIEGRDRSGNRTTDYGTRESLMAVSAAGDIGKALKLGMTGKIVQSRIGEFKANRALALDMGMSYGFKTFGKKMSFGASVTNLGGGVQYLDQKDELPTAVNAGLNAEIGFINLIGGVNHLMNEGSTGMSLGMEFNLSVISLRAGMNALGGTESKGKSANGTAGVLEGLTSGIGLKIGNVRMDYALGQESADLGLSHRMSLTIQFGRKAR